ncbi:MAG: tRNA dimethylallyltransferase [Candidatus Uhrbacteria bacterium]
MLFVVGPTASGKTDLAITLAKEFDGEIINADARQIYRGLTIGTGKPKGRRGVWEGKKAYIVQGVPHYLMDFLPPEEPFSAPEWRTSALKAIRGITARRHLPIVVGGTGLYLSSLIDHFQFPEVKAQPGLRLEYERKPLDDLVRLLLAVDPDSGNIVDLKNKRRVIRALEVVTFSGKKFSEARRLGEPLVEALQIGIVRSKEELYSRIHVSIEHMLEEGLIEEVRTLIKKGVSVDSPGMTAIGYRDFVRYLRGECSLDEIIENFKQKTRQYARRQWTWFKKDDRIRWVTDDAEAGRIVREWLGESRRSTRRSSPRVS